MTDTLPPHLAAGLDAGIFDFAADAACHYGTNDLVVTLDLTESHAEISAAPRLTELAAPDLPSWLRAKILMPAAEAAQVFHDPQRSFWLVVLESEAGYCVAVNAAMIAPGGSA